MGVTGADNISGVVLSETFSHYFSTNVMDRIQFVAKTFSHFNDGERY